MKIKKIALDYSSESIFAAFDCAISTTFAGLPFMKKLGSSNWFKLGGQVCYGNSVKIEEITCGQDTVCDR